MAQRTWSLAVIIAFFFPRSLGDTSCRSSEYLSDNVIHQSLLQRKSSDLQRVSLSGPTESSESTPQDPSPLIGCVGFECAQRYVQLPDPHYSWRISSEYSGNLNSVSYSVRELTMTSQQWLSKAEVDPQVWIHPITIITPSNLKAEAKGPVTLLSGGAMQNETYFLADGTGSKNPDVIAGIQIATGTGSITAVLGLVPVQALKFTADPLGEEREEDEIKAFSWRQLIDHPEQPEWPIELPNLKAVVRAMDTVSATLDEPDLKFITTGCSKRGMASIFAAAYDSRVIAYAPCVITMHNNEAFHRLFESYGPHTVPLAFQDYAAENISNFLDTPMIQPLFAETDPFEYINRLKNKPVLWLHAGRDDFFSPDHTRAFWSQLPSYPKLLSIDANQQHTGWMSDSILFIESVQNFVTSITLKQSLPILRWSLDDTNGNITAELLQGPRPLNVTLWQATTCGSFGRRDFRMYTLDPPEICAPCGVYINVTSPFYTGGMCNKTTSGVYSSTLLEPSGPNVWSASMVPPEEGKFTAFFIQFAFDGFAETLQPFQLSTEELVLPKKYPFPPCHGIECHASVLA